MDGEPVESTLDWYAQDVDGNIWYFGEHSVATDHEECDHPTNGDDPILGLDGCLDGSWEAEAEDMGKILNFKKVDSEALDTTFYGCVVIKEWVPLEPGSIEHKYFCRDIGLVQVEGNAGGKTEWTYLVEVSP